MICAIASCGSTIIEHLRTYIHVRGFIPSAALAAVGYALLLCAHRSVWTFTIVALPGTLAHEVSHFLVGLLFGAKPRGFSLRPQRSSKGWILGTVSFGRISVFNGAFVALAPILLFPPAWLCLMHLAVPAWVAGRWVMWLVAGYLTASAAFAGVPSWQDIKAGAPSLVVYLVVIVACWWMWPTVRSWIH